MLDLFDKNPKAARTLIGTLVREMEKKEVCVPASAPASATLASSLLSSLCFHWMPPIGADHRLGLASLCLWQRLSVLLGGRQVLVSGVVV